MTSCQEHFHEPYLCSGTTLRWIIYSTVIMIIVSYIYIYKYYTGRVIPLSIRRDVTSPMCLDWCGCANTTHYSLPTHRYMSPLSNCLHLSPQAPCRSIAPTRPGGISVWWVIMHHDFSTWPLAPSKSCSQLLCVIL